MRTLCLFGRYAYGDPRRGEGYEYVNFLPALTRMSSEIRLFDTFDRTGYQDFADLNAKLIQAVIEFQPDLIFAVLMHYEVWTETLDLIRAHTPAAILHWGTDDSWKYKQFSRFIARHVDVHATTYARIAQQAARDGLDSVIPTQWAANAQMLVPPLPSAQCCYDVTFVGAAYGNRREWIEALAARGIKVQCFGHGWEGGAVDTARLHEIYRHSRVSLNFGDSGLQLGGGTLHRSRQIKARTFEVPGAGGLLVTETAQDLDTYFAIGKEICAFDTAEDLASTIRDLLQDPVRRNAIASAGHTRVAHQHTYEARFTPLIATARARGAVRRRHPDPLTFEKSFTVVKQHAISPVLRTAAIILRSAGSLALGSARGPRAARRIVFEASWRLAGARTYSSGGWPGRMFYAES